MRSKIVKTLVILIIIVSALIGLILGIKAYQKKNLTADVIAVSNLNYGNYSYMESEGIVSSDAGQNVYVASSEIIKEVYVKEGDTVAVGDKLMAYDMTSAELSVESQQLSVDSINGQISAAQKELNRLKATTPVKTEKILVEPEEDSTEEPYYEEYTPEGYTQEELQKKISEKETELKKLDLDKRKAELALATAKESLTDGIVYAKVNGVVKTVHDITDVPNDGSAFLVVSGSDGLYVKGDVSELQLGQIQIGQAVTATSWETGESYEATISAIDSCPDANPSYWGEGNPNVSYYQYTAFIEDPTGLSNGDSLELTIDDLGGDSQGIYLDSSYIREENGKSYVMKNADGVLTKQYVTTGKISSGGSATEITSGITEEDYLAFPYGKTAQEGVKTNISEEY